MLLFGLRKGMPYLLGPSELLLVLSVARVLSSVGYLYVEDQHIGKVAFHFTRKWCWALYATIDITLKLFFVILSSCPKPQTLNPNPKP